MSLDMWKIDKLRLLSYTPRPGATHPSDQTNVERGYFYSKTRLVLSRISRLFLVVWKVLSIDIFRLLERTS